MEPILIEKYAHIRGFRSSSINNEWVFAYDQAKLELTERLKLGTVTKQQVIDLYEENEDLD